MIKMMVYTGGKPETVRALHFAAEFKKRLNAELSVINLRSGTH